jgi:hypothetical protein
MQRPVATRHEQAIDTCIDGPRCPNRQVMRAVAQFEIDAEPACMSSQ